MIDKEISNKIFNLFMEHNPTPTTELVFHDNFTLLISVILSARSTDKSVNKATKDLFKNYNTPEKILSLGEEGLKKYISKIGLYNNKAKNIISSCKLLLTKYDSRVPDTFEELLTLPGVGRKTANVILNTLFNVNTVAVDTHVYRVSKRIGLANAESLINLEKELITNIDPKWLKNLHHWLVLHGRYICKSRNPMCEQCFIKQFCRYYKNRYLALL